MKPLQTGPREIFEEEPVAPTCMCCCCSCGSCCCSYIINSIIIAAISILTAFTDLYVAVQLRLNGDGKPTDFSKKLFNEYYSTLSKNHEDLADYFEFISKFYFVSFFVLITYGVCHLWLVFTKSKPACLAVIILGYVSFICVLPSFFLVPFPGYMVTILVIGSSLCYYHTIYGFITTAAATLEGSNVD